MRILHAAVVGVTSLALVGVGATAWAMEGTSAASNPAVSHNVPVPSPSGTPVIKPLIIDDNVVKAGQRVSVKGAGCNPGTTVLFSVGAAVEPKRDLGTVTADHAGAFTAGIQLPADLPAGATQLWAACKAPNPTGKELSTATITIVH